MSFSDSDFLKINKKCNIIFSSYLKEEKSKMIYDLPDFRIEKNDGFLTITLHEVIVYDEIEEIWEPSKDFLEKLEKVYLAALEHLQHHDREHDKLVQPILKN